MIEIIACWSFLLTFGLLGVGWYAHGKQYEETRRLEDVAAPREDDLQWTLKYTSVAFGLQNQDAEQETTRDTFSRPVQRRKQPRNPIGAARTGRSFKME